MQLEVGKTYKFVVPGHYHTVTALTATLVFYKDQYGCCHMNSVTGFIQRHVI